MIRRFDGPSHPACVLPGRTVTVTDATRKAKSNGFEIVSESGRLAPGLRALGMPPLIVNGPDGSGALGAATTAQVKQVSVPTTPLPFTARTQKTCEPTPRPTYMAMLEQAIHALLSSLHSAPLPSETEKANAASVEVVLSSG